jgi:hypothetical protein
MIRSGILAGAQARRRHLVLANGTGYWRSDLIAPDAGAPGRHATDWEPQAFLVEQDAGQTILPHYHEQDEFQVIVEGGGRFGRHEVRPVTVHYAGRHTGYGPIEAGPEGLWYFSLRAHADPGARFLPEWRDRIGKGPKRHILAESFAGQAAGTRTVIEPQPDGIAAWALGVAPGEKLLPPALPAGAARYYLVLAGQLADLPRMSVVFASEAFGAVAGPEGACVLCLQFPC